MLRYLFLLSLVFSLNVFSDVFLSSPKIKLNAQDQRVIEFRIENEIIKDGDIVLYEYKTDSPIDKDDIAYTLLESFERYQSYKIVLSETYKAGDKAFLGVANTWHLSENKGSEDLIFLVSWLGEKDKPLAVLSE